MWMNLVNTIAWKIFADLPYYKIVHAGQVCRRWHALSLDDLLWKLVLVRHFNIKTPITLRPGATSWREEFIRMIDEVPSVLTDLPDHHRQSRAVHVSFAHTKNVFSVCYHICGFAVWSADHPCTRLFGIDNDENVEDNERIEAYNSQFNSSDELLLVYGSEVDCPYDGGDHDGRISIYSVVGLENSEQFCLVMWVATEQMGDIHNLWVTNSTFLSFKRRRQYDNEILQYGSEHYMEVYLNNINPVDVEDGSNDVVEGNRGDVDNKERSNAEVDGCGDDMDTKEIRDNNVDVEEDVRNKHDEDKEVYFNYTLLHVYLTSDWENVKISPIKSHEDDIPNILVPMGPTAFEAPGAYAGYRKLHTEIALLDKEGKVEDLKVRNLTNKAFEQIAVLGYCLSPDQRTCYINARLSNLGQFDGDETLQVIPLDLASRTFGPALTGHKGRIGLTDRFCPDVSRDYVGCGSEANGGYLWDRHYGCLVSVLQSKHEQHKTLNAFEDEIQDDVNEDTEEEDLTMALKKMFLEEDDEDEEYWDEDEEYWVMPPCGCGTFIPKKRLPLNEDEEQKAVQSVAIDPVNQDVTVTVGGRTAGRIGRIKVFRSKKWIRENRLAA